MTSLLYLTYIPTIQIAISKTMLQPQALIGSDLIYNIERNYPSGLIFRMASLCLTS